MFYQDRLSNFYVEVIKIGILLILFLPLFVHEQFLFPFVFPRTIVFRVIIEILLILYLSLILINPDYRRRWLAWLKSWRSRPTILTLISAFVGVMIVSSIFGADPYHSFWSSIERSEGIILWLHLLGFLIILLGVFKSKKDWLYLFNAVIIAGWLQAGYALSQVFNLPFALKTTGERISGAIGNPSFLAAYLIFIIFIAAFLFTQYSAKKHKIYYTALILINIFILWQTQTRGAILAFTVGVLFFISIKLWQQQQLKIKLIPLTLVIAMAGFSFLVIANKDAGWIRSSTTLSRLANISTTDVSTQNRLIVWQVGFEGFKQRPILGWGWENFNVPFNKNFDPLITRDIGSRPWYDRAHNVIVETGVTTGLIGLLIYLFIFAWAVKSLLQNRNKKDSIKTDSLLFISLLLAYFLQNLFVFDTLNSYMMLFLVLAFIQSQGVAQSESEKKTHTYASITISKKFVAPIILIIITLPVIYFINVRPVLANYHTVKAITTHKTDPILTQESFSKAFKYSPPNNQELRFILVQHTRDQIARQGLNEETAVLARFAIEEMERSISSSPYAIQNYLILAELYLIAAPLDAEYLQKTESITQLALERAPERYQTYTMLGRLKMQQTRFDEGISYFQEAIALNNNFAEAHWNLAVAYILSSQFELGSSQLEKTAALNFPVYTEKNTNKLLEAYHDSKDLKATIEFLKKIIAIHPDNKNYQQSLAELEQLYEQVVEAVSKTE